MAPENKTPEQMLQSLDVVVTRERDISEVHLASPEALEWIERNVALEHRVIVALLTWPTALAAEVTQAMEYDGLVVYREDADEGLKVRIIALKEHMRLPPVSDERIRELAIAGAVAGSRASSMPPRR